MAVLRFIGKRVAIGVLILVCVTFAVYQLLAFAINPLAELEVYNGPDREIRIQSMIRLLDLDTPPILRYLKWLGGVAGYLFGQGTLGVSSQNGQPIVNELGSALTTTLSLVLAAAILAIILGLVVGLITAIRQYSTFDYIITFISFFLYSLPTFWVAILLKQYGALGFNDFLQNPVIPIPVIIILGLIMAVLTFVISASDYKQRLIWSGGVFVITAGLLLFCSLTGWFAKPGLTIFGVGFLGLIAAAVVTYLSFGINKNEFITSAIICVVFIALYYPISYYVFPYANAWLILGLAVGFGGLGFLFGWLRGGDDRKTQARNGALIGVIFFILFYVDRLMRAFSPYMKQPMIGGRPISTIGSETPSFSGNYWMLTMDSFTHIILPTLTLLLISFAGYVRYTRASVLDVLNADYIRTARAKGLPERSVIMRHAFKNSLIPLATIIPLDVAAILGGAIITETIFGWRGMGVLFQRSLQHSDFNGVMGVLLITASLTILANIIADLLYVVLDPRIRLEN